MFNYQPYYNGTTRKAITIFGSMFKDMQIQRMDHNGDLIQTVAVPLTYAAKDKAIERTLQEPDLDGQFLGPILPRMAFEISGIQYDSKRKLNTNTMNTNINNGTYATQYNPVPYNINLELYLYAKNQEDGLQILEQILPFFTPQFNVTINAVPEMNITQHIPVILNDVTYEDSYAGEFNDKRMIIWTLSFTMQVNYYGPINSNSNIIKSATVKFYNDKDMKNQQFSMNSVVTPFYATEDEVYTIVDTIDGWN